MGPSEKTTGRILSTVHLTPETCDAAPTLKGHARFCNLTHEAENPEGVSLASPESVVEHELPRKPADCSQDFIFNEHPLALWKRYGASEAAVPGRFMVRDPSHDAPGVTGAHNRLQSAAGRTAVLQSVY